MIYFPEELEYSEDDKKALRESIVNYLKGSDVWVLRRFASECGVPSGSNKSKTDAIRLSIQIILKEVAPKPRSNRGAPVKEDKEMDAKIVSLHEGVKGLLYGYFEKKNVEARKLAEGKGMRFKVSQERGEQAFSGIYVPEKSGGSIRRSLFFFNPTTDVVVDEQQAILFPFKAGDEVVCVSEPQPCGPRRLRRVVAVNSHEVDQDFKVMDRFDDIAPNYPDNILPLSGSRAFDMVNALCPVLFGQRVLVVAPNEANLNELFIRFASVDAEVFSVMIGQGVDDNAYASQKIKNCVVCRADASGAASAVLALERAKRIAENGENAVVIINDLNSLLFACGSRLYPDGVYGGTTYAALTEVSELFSSARSLSTGGSLTVIGFIKDGAYPSVGVETGKLLRLAQCRLYVGGDIEADGVPYFDFSRSKSNGENVLPENDRAVVNDIRAKRYGENDFVPNGEESAADIIKRLS